ncbi:hypothetical protein C1N91_07550 [Curtobacterium sp. SGAir0471]|uniref:hypothetical protein n=1 Tax=Curtobacterium sp. SGAir0471 TaxID=2070337 RepID=UPI0010CD2F46|nr:hypothetical protein [Curtobacterium sp. SGAir0471]QCR43423.1 hypothetical protein C1N91_07550 [Curtobacterium sp. SGAir0471]
MFVAVFNGTSSVIRMDDAEVNGSVGTGAPGRMEIGRNTNSSGFAQVDIAEVGSFARALTAAERAELVSNLRGLYSL